MEFITHFREYELGAVIKFSNGKAIKPGGAGANPVYGSNGKIGGSDEYHHRNAIVIGRVGAYCGSIVFETGRFWASDNTIVAEPNNEFLNTKFGYYLLIVANLHQYAGGAAQPLLTQTNIKRVKVSLPPLVTQNRIASILSAYDDLIENNTRRIQILEEMAQRIYKEWFVDFRFPGHEKAEFVDSELGRIPGGWELTEFRNLFQIKYGKTLPKTRISDTGKYPVYGAGDVIGYYDKALCYKKCALITSRGNGSGTVWRTRGEAFITNNSLIIYPQKAFSHWGYTFILLLLKNSNVMEARTGSAQPQITIENLNYVKGVVPDKANVEQFCSLATPLFDLTDLYYIKNSNLRQTRDLLLPKLISGEIDVSEMPDPKEAATA